MEPPARKPNRLGYYDYSTPGAYFVTICTKNHRCTLSSVVGDGSPVPFIHVALTHFGKIVDDFILEIPKKYPSVHVDKYVIMPNHIHLLLSLYENSGTGNPSPTVEEPAVPGTGNPSPTLGNVIGWFKYQVTKEINLYQGTVGTKIFQRSYHDHVIRNVRDYQRIWNYIDGNPARWREDCFYTEDTGNVEDTVPYECEEYQ